MYIFRIKSVDPDKAINMSFEADSPKALQSELSKRSFEGEVYFLVHHARQKWLLIGDRAGEYKIAIKAQKNLITRDEAARIFNTAVYCHSQYTRFLMSVDMSEEVLDRIIERNKPKGENVICLDSYRKRA